MVVVCEDIVRIVAIDPGEHTGWALFEDGILRECGLATLKKSGVPVAHANKVVIERPRQRTGGLMRSRDLITLALRAGEWAGRYNYLYDIVTEYVQPEVWKGSTPKAVSERRIYGALQPEEALTLIHGLEKVASRLQNNVVDAVGIGLWAVGRRA